MPLLESFMPSLVNQEDLDIEIILGNLEDTVKRMYIGLVLFYGQLSDPTKSGFQVEIFVFWNPD